MTGRDGNLPRPKPVPLPFPNGRKRLKILKKIVVQYFENIFCSSNPQLSSEVFEAVVGQVTQAMNAILMQEFRANEVNQALFQMHPTKAPGLDAHATEIARIIAVVEVEWWCSIGWEIWNSRNLMVHGNSSKNPTGVALHAKEYITVFQQTQVRQVIGSSKVVPQGSRWSPLEEGKYKLNVDGSWDPKLGLGSVGGVIRDWKGEVIGGFGKHLGLRCSTSHAEVLAILYGLIFARDLGISDMFMESDYLNALLTIQAPTEDYSELGHLVHEARKELFWFRYMSCLHVRREGKSLAHAMASYARNLTMDMF
ncbi:hypothetical protein F0562_010871 [Nyssa sinensis]|uniref:RNase H type-1 domain-containing protein n=1 Tax=Nyssa sinensis TaxID=561372 RepID=A0A5J5A364_9ASTE|nr:hypothetical protein F0562_010871 [Nyssa sinensis]